MIFQFSKIQTLLGPKFEQAKAFGRKLMVGTPSIDYHYASCSFVAILEHEKNGLWLKAGGQKAYSLLRNNAYVHIAGMG